MTTAELIEKIKSNDDAVRGAAWQTAGPAGAASVQPLAEVMAAAKMETARAAKRALWNVVRYAGRPGAQAEKKAVAAELVPLLGAGSPDVRREWVWMISEIGGDEAVPSLAALLNEPALREDARAALQRIPGRKSLNALKAALTQLPADYRPAVAVSLRARGVPVAGYSSEKLVPTKRTEVKQISGV